MKRATYDYVIVAILDLLQAKLIKLFIYVYHRKLSRTLNVMKAESKGVLGGFLLSVFYLDMATCFLFDYSF